MATIRINYPGNVAPVTQSPGAPAAAFITPDAGAGDTAMRAAAGLLAEDRQQREAQARYILHKTDQFEREQRAKAEQDFERARRNTAAATFATYQVDLGQAVDGLTNDLMEGKVKREDADKVLQQRIGDLKKQHLDPLDPTSQADLADNVIRFDGAANAKLTQAMGAVAKKERASAFTTLTEALQRQAVADPAGAIRQAKVAFDGEGAAIYGADVATKQYQQFAEHAWATHFTERLNGVRKDSHGLAALEKDVTGNAALDPDKKNILLGRISGFRETLAAAAERAAQSRERTLRSQIDAADKLILAGFEPSAQQLSALATAAKGTPYEPVVRAQVAFANQSAQFRAMAPRGQEAFLNDFERQVRANPTPDATRTLERYRSIYTAQREAVQADPISFAGQKGLADVQPLDFTRPDTLSDQLQARAQVARGMQAQYGSPLKVLTTEEASTVGRLMREGSVSDKRQLLGALSQALPDRSVYMATMGQIAPDDPVAAVAGSVARRPDGSAIGTTKGRLLSDLMLRGQALLAPNRKEDGKPSGGTLIKMPPDKDLDSAFASYEGNAFAGKDQARNAMLQSAKAVYAALSSDEGDSTGVINSSRWQTAMQLATGGIEKINGRSVVLPYGYDSSKFRDELLSRTAALAPRLDAGMTPQRLRHLPMENVGDGRYVFRAGDGVLADKAGKPIVVDFNEPAR